MQAGSYIELKNFALSAKAKKKPAMMVLKHQTLPTADGKEIVSGLVEQRGRMFHVVRKTTQKLEGVKGGQAVEFDKAIHQAYEKPENSMLDGKFSPALQFGADPEIFVMNDKELLPAFEFLQTKKKSPTYFMDGFAAEFTTGSFGCLEIGCGTMRRGMELVVQAARAKNPKAKLTIQNTFEIPEETRMSAKAEHIALGCKPSLNIYGEDPVFVENPRELAIRSAGGHIHMSCSSSYYTDYKNYRLARMEGVGKDKLIDEKTLSYVVRALDQFCAVACVSLFAKLDDPRRRQFYGRAGEYRLPKHGFEYRALSNGWLCHPSIFHLVWNTARAAIRIGINKLNKALAGQDDRVRAIINVCDVDEARKLLIKNQPVYEAIYDTTYGAGTGKKTFARLLTDVGEIVNISNIEENWGLTPGYIGEGFYLRPWREQLSRLR